MLCDELKSLWVYSRDINENCDEEFVNFAKENGYEELVEKKEVIEAIAELKSEIKRKDGVSKRWFARCMDARTENVKLKRALWLARAKRAEARKNYWYVRSIHEGDKNLWSIDGSAVKYIGCIKRTNFDWLLTWGKVEDKCLKKAEEYK